MDCIYERKDLEDYFEVMLRIQSRLTSWKSFSVQSLYNMILQIAMERMKSLRRGVIDEMKNCGLIRTMSVQRVQSQDDYSLITSNGYSGRSYFTGMGQNSGMFSPSHNDFSKSSINLLMDERGQYEKSRRISRYNMFWERHDNRCRMLTF